jgi:hypothetical protein
MCGAGEPQILQLLTNKQTNSVGFSPQANYTATGRRILVPIFVDRGVSRGQRGGLPMAVNLFSMPSPLLFLSRSSSVMLTELSGLHTRKTATQKFW